jgi:hypothetical protein
MDSTIERMLNVIAILRAFHTKDAEGLEVLIKEGPKTAYFDLLMFILSQLETRTNGRALEYLDEFANALVLTEFSENSNPLREQFIDCELFKDG